MEVCAKKWHSKHFFTLALVFVCILKPTAAIMNNTGKWFYKKPAELTYPDLRKDPGKVCGKHVPEYSYLCDPDRILQKESDAKALNDRLHLLASTAGKKCPCQRKSQCSVKYGDTDIEVRFVVAIVFARDIVVPVEKPDARTLQKTAEQFTKHIRGKWALGDCGNAALILVYILTDREYEKFVTDEELTNMHSKVQSKMQQGQYVAALEQIIDDIKNELNGTEEKPVDIGILSLIFSVALAILFVSIITGCVCAFRCCGNLRPDADTPLGQTLETVDTVKADMFKRGGSAIRRSFSRSSYKAPFQAPTPSIGRLDMTSPKTHKSVNKRDRTIGSPSATRHLLPTITVAPPMPKTNMSRLANPYYSGDDGHSMV